MANLPAFCDSCGTAFNSGISATSVISLTITNSKSGPCPACGQTGSIPDGTFNVQDHLITLLSGPVSTYEKMQQLHHALEQARSSNKSTDETLKAVESIDPTIAAIVRTLRPDRVAAYLGLILATADLIMRLHSPAPLTREDAEALIREATVQMQPKDTKQEEINSDKGNGPHRVDEVKKAGDNNQGNPNEPIRPIRT